MLDVLSHKGGQPVTDQSRHRPVRKPSPQVRRVGYARTKPDQDDLRQAVLELQRLGVQAALVFTDRGSSARGKDRGELQAAINTAQPGDVLVVFSLARLARSHHDLAAIIEALDGRGVVLEINGQRLDQVSGSTMITLTGQLQADLITEVIAEHNAMPGRGIHRAPRERDRRGQT